MTPAGRASNPAAAAAACRLSDDEAQQFGGPGSDWVLARRLIRILLGLDWDYTNAMRAVAACAGMQCTGDQLLKTMKTACNANSLSLEPDAPSEAMDALAMWTQDLCSRW